MGIDMDRVGGFKWHLCGYLYYQRIFWLRSDAFHYPKPLISIAGWHFLSKTVTLDHRYPLRPLRRFDLGGCMLSFQFVDPMSGRPPAVEHKHRYQIAFLAFRTPSV